MAWLADWELGELSWMHLTKSRAIPECEATIKSSKLLQKVIWRLLLVVYLKLNGLLITIYVDLLIFSSP